MRLLIAVPSKNRWETFRKNAYSWAFKTKYPARLFLEPQDVIKYDDEEEETIVLEENNRGLGYAKAQIKLYAEREGYDLVFKLDDDISGFSGFRSRLKGEEMITHFEQEVDKIIKLFQEKKSLAAVGFPYDFQMFRNQMTSTVRLQTAYIVRTKLMDSDSNLSVFEDFGEGISKIAKGFVMVRWPNLGIQMGVPVGGGTGGHQSYDRGPKAELEARYLAKKYPGLQFKRVDKEWKVEPDLSSVRKLFSVKK